MPKQAVAIVVYEGVQALDVAGPMDVFSEANTFLGSADRYETVLVAAHRDPLRASNGIRMVADLTFDEASDPDDLTKPVERGKGLPCVEDRADAIIAPTQDTAKAQAHVLRIEPMRKPHIGAEIVRAEPPDRGINECRGHRRSCR